MKHKGPIEINGCCFSFLFSGALEGFVDFVGGAWKQVAFECVLDCFFVSLTASASDPVDILVPGHWKACLQVGELGQLKRNLGG